MSDAAIENALARRAHASERLEAVVNEINELLDRHNALKEEINDIDGFIRMWYEMAGIQQPLALEQKRSEPPAEGGKRIRPKNPARELVAEACVEYIRKAGRPLMRSELLKELQDDGLIIRGKDPAMVLSTMLWRSKDVIQRLPEGGYWPAGDTTPAERMLKDLGIVPNI